MPWEGGGNTVGSVGSGSVVGPEGHNNSGIFNMTWDRISPDITQLLLYRCVFQAL